MATKVYSLVLMVALAMCSNTWAASLHVTDTTDQSVGSTLVARDLNGDFAAHNVTFNQETVANSIISSLSVTNLTVTGTMTLTGDLNAVNITASGFMKAQYYTGNTNVILKPGTDGAGAIQLQTSVGSTLVSLDTTTGSQSFNVSTNIAVTGNE